MKNVFLVLIALTLAMPLWAQEVKTQVTEITAYRNETAVVRKGSAILKAGEQKLVFVALPEDFDVSSIAVISQPPLQIFDIKSDLRTQEHDSLKARSIVLEKRYVEKVNEMKLKEMQRDLLLAEEQVLSQNTVFGGSESGLPNDRLMQNLNFYKSRLLAIKTELFKASNDIEQLRAEMNNIYQQQIQLALKRQKPERIVEVVVDVNTAGNYQLELKYLSGNTYWRPFYELKAGRLNQPIELNMKAMISQSTGEDWKQVKTTLSTAEPRRGNNLPGLNPFELRFGRPYTQQMSRNSAYAKTGIIGRVNGMVMNQRTREAVKNALVLFQMNGKNVGSTTTASDGSFQMDLKQKASSMKVQVLGYHPFEQYIAENQNKYFQIALNESSERYLKEVEMVSMAVRDVTSDAPPFSGAQYDLEESQDALGKTNTQRFKDNAPNLALVQREPTNLIFQIQRPQNISSDGQEMGVSIRKLEVNALFTHRAHPELDDKAYLFAAIPQWEELNLLEGEAGLYIQDQYLGKTYIDTKVVDDTLEIGMGRDESVQLKREAVVAASSRSTLGNTVKENRTYKITIRNTKPDAIQLVVVDRLPISTDPTIEVKPEALQGGKLNAANGLIEWKLEVPANQSATIEFSYHVKYPKGKIINLPR